MSLLISGGCSTSSWPPRAVPTVRASKESALNSTVSSQNHFLSHNNFRRAAAFLRSNSRSHRAGGSIRQTVKIKVRRHGKSCSLPCERPDDGSTKSRPAGRHLPVFQNHGPRPVSAATPTKGQLLFRPGRRGALQNRSLAHREGAIRPAKGAELQTG